MAAGLAAYQSTPCFRLVEQLSCRPLNPYLNWERVLLRKEVIQPQVPLRLPCYDFIPVTAHTLGPCLPAEAGLAQTLRVQATPMM
jgi:hypothetical protein